MKSNEILDSLLEQARYICEKAEGPTHEDIDELRRRGKKYHAALASLPQPSQVSAEQLERSWDSLRDLAVQIVDNSCGFTIEFSSSPSNHRSNYEWVEEKLKEVAALAATSQPQQPLPAPPGADATPAAVEEQAIAIRPPFQREITIILQRIMTINRQMVI